MFDVNINLLPGVAEKERRLRERRQKILLVFLLVSGNLFVTLLSMFFIFHNSSLENNLSDLKNKISVVKKEITQFNEIEKIAMDLKARVVVIEKIRINQSSWENLLEVISAFTVKTIQYTEIRPEKNTIKISGITPTWLDLEKNKNSLATAVININYLVQDKDSWDKIAKKYGYTLDAFVKFHNIDQSILPQPGKIIKIKKPVFSSVQVINMIQQAEKKDKFPFILELTLIEGALK